MPVMTLEELFYKYLDENITPEELSLFREMATREENRAELDRLFAQWMNQDLPFTQPEEIDVEAMYLELTRKKNIPFSDGRSISVPDGQNIPVPDGRPIGRSRSFGIRGALLAAACLLLVVSLSFCAGRLLPSCGRWRKRLSSFRRAIKLPLPWQMVRISYWIVLPTGTWRYRVVPRW
jgi:hypothetical protein